MSNEMVVLQADAKGKFTLPGVARSDIQRVDVADVDLVITTKGGAHYLLPDAGMGAMSENPPQVGFSNGILSTDQLLAEVGTVIDLASAIPAPSSLKLNGAQDGCAPGGGSAGAGAAQGGGADGKDGCAPKTPDEQHSQTQSQSQVSSLTVNTEATTEQLVQNAAKIVQDLHSSDFDYVPPHQFEPPPSALSPPAGVPPPINLTPIVTLFMGNVVGTTQSTANGVTTIYGGGGAVGSDSFADIGPRNALQFSAATITGTAGNDIIYAEGPLVGNPNPAVNTSHFSKEFLINVAGYFTTLNDIVFKGVPTGVTITGATLNPDGSWTLPSSYALKQNSFQLIYSTTAATGTFDIQVDISGVTTRALTFSSQQDFRFQYLPETSVSQVTDPTLVYDDQGLSKEVYILPTLDNPNIINSGQGNDIVYSGPNSDTITVGDGADQVFAQNGNNIITAGAGADTIAAGSGNNTITAGNGGDTISVGSGANSITTGSGNDTITTGDGNNVIIDSGGNNTITVGAGNNSITAGNGNNTVQTGNGNNVVQLGAGTANVATGSGNDAVTVAGGGGTINVGSGNNSITVNSAASSADTYVLTATGTGINTISGGDDLYTISLGAGTNTVTLGNGTSGFNTQITAGAGTNVITTGNGQHTVNVGAGVATISTGTGNDTVTTAGGGGTINVGSGNNSITVNSVAASTDTYVLTTSGTGTNTISGGDDLYTVNLGAGTNSVTLGNGTSAFNTQITAGAGTNTITTGNGQHTINVGAGVATISTGTGNDVVTTAGGGGTINLGTGNNSITVNSVASSTDTYVLTTTGTGTNTISGGDDLYTVNLGAGTNTVTLGNGTTGFNTQITAGAGTNTITTGNGQHTINVGAGVATIATGTGNDTVTTAGGGGTINVGDGNNTIIINSLAGSSSHYTLSSTGTGTTNITAGDDNYTITASSGVDTISLGNGTSSVTTGASADHINAGNGSMTINAGAGDNVISTGTGVVNITSGSGNDTITTSGGGGTINAGDGTNHVTVTSGNYTITTGSGNDTIVAGDGNNVINTGAGTNSVTAGNGANTITGGSGNDTLLAGNGNNTFYPGTGTNIVTGGTGVNTVNYSNVSAIPLTISLGGPSVLGSTTGTGVSDTLTNISNVVGNDAGDTIHGTGIPDNLSVVVSEDFYLLNAQFVVRVDGVQVGGILTTTAINGSGQSQTFNLQGYFGNGSHVITVEFLNDAYGGAGLDRNLYVKTVTLNGITNTLNLGEGSTGNTATTTITSSTSAAQSTTVNVLTGGAGNDIITAGTAAATIFGGNGNNILTGGLGSDTIFGGNGNNIIDPGATGSDKLYGGSGNNAFIDPHAGVAYSGTNGAALATVTNNLAYSFVNNGVTTNLYLNTQINSIDYTADTVQETINLASGIGSGGLAQGSTYAFTAVSGYSSINEIIGSYGGTIFTPSLSDTIFIGGATTNSTVNDTGTLATQNMIIAAGDGGNVFVTMGAAHETIVGNPSAGVQIYYSSSPSGVVVNLDSVSHSFVNSLGATITVAAYSGGEKFVTASDALSYSIGDYYEPISGTNTGITQINGSGFGDYIYGGSNDMNVYAGGGNNTVIGGTGRLTFYGNNGIDNYTGGSGANFYAMSYGNDRANGGTGSTNTYYTNTNNNISVYLAGAADANGNGVADYIDHGVTSLTSGGITYTGFAFGWNNETSANSNSTTLFSRFENVLGANGNDTIVGDNNGNQINGQAGSNTILTGSGNDIITDIQGSNSINAGAGVNTLNMENTTSTMGGFLGQYSAQTTTPDSIFLTDGTFFGASDKVALWGSSNFSGFQSQTSGVNYSTITNIQNINGSDYASGSTTAYDELLYGTTGTNTIVGNSGNNIIAGGGGADTLYGGAGNNIFYETLTQLNAVTLINGTASTSTAIVTGHLDTLRVPGWGETTGSGNAFGTTDPFNGETKWLHINVLDVRTGTDTISTSTFNGNPTIAISSTAGSTVNTVHPTYNLSATDISTLVGNGNTSSLTLKLDNGSSFTPTTGAFTDHVAVVNQSNTDVIYHYYNNAGHTTLIATLDVHFGTG